MDTLFFLLSKFVWLMLRPESWLVLALGVAWASMIRGRLVLARRVTAGVVISVLVLGVFPVGNALLAPLERAYPASPDLNAPKGIVVLGGAESEGPDFAGNPAQTNDAADRLITTVELARRWPDAVVLYTGGRASIMPLEEGVFEIGPDILRRLGLSKERLIVESQSRTTAENATLSLGLRPSDPTNGPWVLVTSAFHMPRAVASFCTAGWGNLIPYPVDFRTGAFWHEFGWDFAENLRELNYGVKEWIGLLAYRATGRINAFFPDNCVA